VCHTAYSLEKEGGKFEFAPLFCVPAAG